MKAKHKSLGMKKPDDYAGSGEPNVVKDAMKKKFGGKVVEKPEGKKSKMRMDKRPRRASGGRCSPFSSAASPKQNIDA